MKKITSLILAICLLISGSIHSSMAQNDLIDGKTDFDVVSGFTGLNDPNFLQYIEDTTYASLASAFSSDDYVIKEVNAIYISSEYLEELEYNSKTNVFFGYSLAELDARFSGTRYAFTLGRDGGTTVEVLKVAQDETFHQILQNVAIGSGIILVCVTVSIVSAGLGAPGVSIFFAASAKEAVSLALQSTLFGGITAGMVRGIETNNFDEAVKAAALVGSEGFKWGAMVGAISGGANELLRIRTTIPTPRESELRVLKKYKGVEQVSYLAGKEVKYGTLGSTRPDVVRTVANGLTECIEVKNYDLSTLTNRNALINEVYRQVMERVNNLPEGSLQRVVLDVRGRQYSSELVDGVVQSLKDVCSPIYLNLPVDVMR